MLDQDLTQVLEKYLKPQDWAQEVHQDQVSVQTLTHNPVPIQVQGLVLFPEKFPVQNLFQA